MTLQLGCDLHSSVSQVLVLEHRQHSLSNASKKTAKALAMNVSRLRKTAMAKALAMQSRVRPSMLIHFQLRHIEVELGRHLVDLHPDRPKTVAFWHVLLASADSVQQ